MSAYGASLVRTGVPYLVAWLLSLPLAGPVLNALGVGSDAARVKLTALLVFLAGSLYYAIARTLERRWPRLGVLLALPVQPTYSAPASGHPSTEQLALDTGAPMELVAA